MKAEDAALEHVGQIVADKYHLLRLLGAGGMGAVYEAEHVFTKRRVAVKRMLRDAAKSKLAAERFVRESQAPSTIGHPGIVQVLDGGFDVDGSPYLVLELLQGVSMREALDEDALQPEQIVQIGVELLEALAAAHDKGFIHRDIKPDNIFLADDAHGGVTVKLLDFGIASMCDTATDVRLTQAGAVLGSPLYMSPEQATGRSIDVRSDLWSVGALLYRALSGVSPFQGDSYNALIVSIVTQDHLPLSQRRSGLPAALHAVVERALQKDADRRFASAREMLGALRRVSLVGQPQFAAPRPAAARAMPVPSRGFPNWIVWTLAGAVIVPTSIAVLRAGLQPQRELAASARIVPPSQPPTAAAEPNALQPTAAEPSAPPTAAGPLSFEQVTRVLEAQQPQMQTCLQDAVAADLRAGASTTRPLQLDIELHISSDGHADAVRIQGAVPAQLERCVRARLREAVFPTAGVATEFRYPLHFESRIIGL